MVPLKKSTDKKEEAKLETSDACILLSKGILRKKVTGKIETMLPKKAFEIKYKGSEYCSFELLIQALRTYVAYQEDAAYVTNELTISYIKNTLVDEYKTIIKKSASKERQVLELFKAQQKNKSMIDSVINSEISLDIFILSEKNNITLIDIWLLALRFNIPIILITSTVFMENKKNVFVTHGSDDNTYIVIRQHGVLPNKVTKYSLVWSDGRARKQITFLI